MNVATTSGQGIGAGSATGSTGGGAGGAGGAGRRCVDQAALALGSERYLAFMLGGETYALPILDVTEIIEFRTLTTIPMMPEYIRGVINLRGRVVPVVDMSVRFGRGRTEVDRRSAIVIVDTDARTQAASGQRAIGVLVDAVTQVMHLGADDIEPPPDLGSGLGATFVQGMAKDEDGFTVVLDLSRLLTDQELAAVESIGVNTATPASP